LWLIKVWFSASTFVVKIATFAKPETDIGASRGMEMLLPIWLLLWKATGTGHLAFKIVR
jgi:hypothetical protein